MEQTLILIKPDGVVRGLVGEVLRRFEQRGFKLVAAQMLCLSPAMADQHYAEHLQKPFYPELKRYITSGPLFAAVLSGPEAIMTVRRMVGETNPLLAAPGTIRGDFALDKTENIIHASDSSQSAAREIALFFPNQNS